MSNASGHTSTSQRVERVATCRQCPFYDIEREKCYAGSVVQFVPWNMSSDDGPPEWCPLRKGPILIMLSVKGEP